MTTFHCATLCSGPCCAPLLHMLTRSQSGVSMEPRKDTPVSIRCAIVAVLDPVKLAELMALALRARGFGGAIYVHEQELHVCWSMTANCTTTQWLTVPQARARLLRIMHTPADPTSRDECERILRGDDGV